MPPADPPADLAPPAEPADRPTQPAPQPGADAPSRAEIDRWVAQGRYAEAAAALRAQGELEPAQALLESIWDYPAALAVATERGDLLAQLRLALLTTDLSITLATTARLLPLLAAAPPELHRPAAALLEQHQQYALAAQMYETTGDLTAALRCHEQAGQHESCARLYERQGDLRAAANAYEQLLAQSRTEAHDRGLNAQDQSRAKAHDRGLNAQAQSHAEAHDRSLPAQAHRGLGRILGQLGRQEDAIKHLQQARALLHETPPASVDSAALDEVEVALVRGLGGLGHASVAHFIMLAYAARHPEEPLAQTAAEFIVRHSPPPTAPPPPETPPTLLGRYQLLRLLGSGGMGRVYLAEDQLTGRSVALKLLPAHGATADSAVLRPGSPAELWSRFVQEAQLLRGLRHPNIVQLLDFHPEAGALVMEYLPGGSLAQRQLPLLPSVVRQALLDVLAGLGAAHAAGVLHRDLKPHNLLCSATGETRLGDFGAAYLQGLGATRTESFIGTLAYMAPEQLTGQPLSFATDLYALAVTAFQLLTGRLPFAGPDFIGQHLHDTPPDPRSYIPSLPESWTSLLRKALHKSPADRYASVEDLRNAVLSLPTDPDSPRPAPPPNLPEPPPHSPATPRARTPSDRGQVWLEGASPVLQTPYSTVALGLDLRLGRPVLVECFHKPGQNPQLLARHLQWLRNLAPLAGPGLQRILRIELGRTTSHDPDGPDDVEVHYEVPIGPHATPGTPLASSDANLLRRTLRRLHKAGVTHGQVQSSVICEPTAAILLIHGRGPLSWPTTIPPTPEDDLAQLEHLLATP